MIKSQVHEHSKGHGCEHFSHKSLPEGGELHESAAIWLLPDAASFQCRLHDPSVVSSTDPDLSSCAKCLDCQILPSDQWMSTLLFPKQTLAIGTKLLHLHCTIRTRDENLVPNSRPNLCAITIRSSSPKLLVTPVILPFPFPDKTPGG